VQHTFAIPSLGLNVPVASPTTVSENNNLCGTSPCTAANQDQNSPHAVVKFTFKTPSTPGTYRWQCFVPCGGGYVDGNGGPMGTPGYMMGQMEVQA
jgi:heme/copper-type cytochrome/quinol oxidase subunit 2